MATFDLISYTYKLTALCSKSANACCKPASNQPSIFNKLPRSRLSNAALDGSQLLAPAAADNNGGYGPGIQAETGTCYSSSSNDDYLPTVKEILYLTLQKKNSTTVDPSPGDLALGVEEVVSEERSGVIDYGRSAPGDNSSGSLDDPIDLLGSDDSSASKAEIDDGTLYTSSKKPDTDLFYSPEIAVNLTARAPSSSPYRRHDIDNFLDISPRPQLAEQEALASDSMRPNNPPLHLSNKLLHDYIDIEGFYTRWARSDSARPQSLPLCQSRASPENQLSKEDYLSIGQSVIDEHEHDYELVPSIVNTDSFDEGERRQQEVEADEAANKAADENNDKHNSQAQQEVNSVATALAAKGVSDTYLPSQGDGRPAKRQQLLPSYDLSPGPSHNGIGSYSDSHSDDKLNNKTDSDNDNRKPRPVKRKRPSLSCDGLTSRKRRRPLQQRPARQPKPRSEPRRRSPKSHSLCDQGSIIVAVSSTKGRLPLLAPSALHATDTDMSPDCRNPGRSSGNVLPTLTKVTFRPRSLHCCSFTAVIQDGCSKQGVSFSQLA